MSEFEEPPARPATLDDANTLIARLWDELNQARRELARAQTVAAAGHEGEELLEVGVRLSESVLWPMQEEYFRSLGIAAWERVPYYITNNTFIARTYAELIVAFLVDYQPYLDPAQPVYVVEMAAGIACFSYYVIREVVARLAHFRQLQGLRVCYVITDITEANIRWLETRPEFAPLLAAGQVDFACFMPEQAAEIRLRYSGQTLAPGSLANPLIAIANYFFDSIRQDMFRVVGDRLEEALFTFFRRPAQAGDSSALDALIYHTQYAPVGSVRYADPVLDEILHDYAGLLKDAGFLLPVGAFACLRHLLTLSGHRLVLLSSDKGSTALHELEGLGEPQYQLHGSLSYGVNYEAIGRYFQSLGGTTLATSLPNLSLVTLAGYLLRGGEYDLEHSRYHFKTRLTNENPINYLYYSQYLMDVQGDVGARNVLRALLAMLHLCNCDPVAFGRCAEWIYGVRDQMTDRDREELLQVLRDVQQHLYPTENQYAASFWLGRFFFALRELDRARACFQHCIAVRPNSANAYYNLGLVQQELEQFEPAAESYSMYLALAPAAADAADVWQRIEELKATIATSPPAASVGI